MGKVPDHVIAEIRDRVDIVELIGGYVQLKRSGRNFQGLCPFHQEKTGSFNVNPDRAIYHCFGCGVTGDVFSFLMEHDHLSFPEALRQLAGRAGVDLAKYEGVSSAASGKRDLLYRAHALAVRLYRETLKRDEGRAAREEISRRGLSQEIVDEYRLGAASDSWDRLLSVAAKDGIRPDVLERAGLAIRKDSGGYYDRFRGRLMFPIEVIGGKVIGFGGRILGEGEPKYLNSPESPLFQKRKTLYGFPQAQDSIRKERRAILVEGYTDVLALAEAGIRGALASLGTAFTPDHATFLARSCDEVLVLFDGDEAGQNAARASCGALLGAGLKVRVIFLPAGEDPDSLIRREGPDRFRERLESGQEVLDALLGEEAFEDGAGRERAVRRVLEALAPIRDPLRTRVYLEELSDRIGLPGEMLAQQLKSLRARPAARERASKPEVPEAARVVEAPKGPIPPLERTFLAVLVHDPDRGGELLERFDPQHLVHPLARRIAEKAAELLAQGQPLEATTLLDAFSGEEEVTEVLGELSVAPEYEVEIARQAEDCGRRLEQRSLEREMELVMQEMRKAKARGDRAQLMDFARKRSELARGLASLATRESTH